jgi:subtilisin family serine protease
MFARELLLSLSLAAATGVAGVASAGGFPEDPLVPGELIVRADSPAALATTMAALSSQFAGIGVVDQIAGRPIYLISYALAGKQSPGDVDLVLGALVAQGTIAWGELNYAGQTSEGKTDSLWLSGLGINANSFAAQYGGSLLGLGSAHQRSTSAGVVIAVVDTGIDPNHPALAGRVSTLGASFVAGSTSTADIGDGVDSDGDGLVDEQVGHGTFVAGIIGLVAPDAMLLPVRVLDSEGVGGNYQVAKALAWSIDRGAHVVNMSLGETYRSQTLEDIVAEADLAGIVVLGAAGNSNTDDPREYPACDSSAIGVTALDWNDVRAPFANFGDRIGLSAPGRSNIVGGSIDPTKAIIGPVPGGGYAAWQGTSFATAFASGVAALVRAQHPDWPSKAVPPALIRATLLQTLGSTGAPVDPQNPGYGGQLGLARVSASGATAAAPVAPGVADVNADGDVNALDLASLLARWGPCEPSLREDINADGAVNALDLAALLARW